MTNSIDLIVENTIYMGPKFISPELMNYIAWVGQRTNLFKNRSPSRIYSKVLKGT
jgi:hypothetical protein